MLLLLPPSEGKTAPSARRSTVDLAALSFAETLGPLRGRLIEAVDPALASAPTAPAAEVYSGVLYARLDHGSLPAAAKRRARANVLVASGLWGMTGLADRIPAYKLPIDARVDGLGTLAAAWRPLVAQALASHDRRGELVVDCRSGGYAAVWRPAHAPRVEVRAFKLKPGGSRQVISHMAKDTRGRVARELLLAARAPRRPADVLAIVLSAGLDAELAETPGRDDAWTLDVLER
ncbi:YaaA family protein [Conexibacter sp. CPCC 206217]|uniref:YaaA family protein n=1 Tax=Conexibacter sp. CPCC 206217 TaxID=3064574 RepID=UPI00271C9084|nr:peroxide stress protein YaaA [Conexibacter sp. CPCC 206217]MDO8214196.1 peroxide stress protein YaaA [Conexibacter sp. CPCC 206217]